LPDRNAQNGGILLLYDAVPATKHVHVPALHERWP
jgi:hypothetical protein